MAAVKTKRTGPVLKTKFTISPCKECGGYIEKLEDAYRVLSIVHEPPKSKRFSWMHKKCTGFGGK
jgi:hypothetical protein